MVLQHFRSSVFFFLGIAWILCGVALAGLAVWQGLRTDELLRTATPAQSVVTKKVATNADAYLAEKHGVNQRFLTLKFTGVDGKEHEADTPVSQSQFDRLQIGDEVRLWLSTRGDRVWLDLEGKPGFTPVMVLAGLGAASLLAGIAALTTAWRRAVARAALAAELALVLFAIAMPVGSAAAGAAPCKAGDAPGCTKKCDAGDLESCFRLAGLYGRGKGVEKSFERTVELLSKGCDGGHAQSCGELGFLFDNGAGVQKNAERAARYYEKGCEKGHLPACVNLGTSLEARAGPGDLNAAARWYRKACEGNEASGCFNLGNLHRLAKDYGGAAALWAKACDGKDPAACYNLAVMHREGSGIPKDESKAKKLMRRACELGEKAACK